MSLAVPGSSMGQPEWQNLLKERMMSQQSQDEVHKELIGNCERHWCRETDQRGEEYYADVLQTGSSRERLEICESGIGHY